MMVFTGFFIVAEEACFKPPCWLYKIGNLIQAIYKSKSTIYIHSDSTQNDYLERLKTKKDDVE